MHLPEVWQVAHSVGQSNNPELPKGVSQKNPKLVETPRAITFPPEILFHKRAVELVRSADFVGFRGCYFFFPDLGLLQSPQPPGLLES